MKVLQANKFFFKNGGSETVMFQERDYLLNHGHQVIDFSMQDARNIASEYQAYFVSNRNYRQDASNKLTKVFDAVSFIHSTEAVKNIRRLIQDTQPDLVHCHNIYHQLTPSIIGAAKKLGVPVVLTLHDYKPVCPTYNRLRGENICSSCLEGDFSQVLRHRCADGSLGKSALLYAEAIIQDLLASYQQVDAFIAPSQFMQQSISHRVEKSRVKLLHNGVDVNLMQPAEGDAGYVLYIGRLVKEKGVDTLLKAHAGAQGQWPLVVAGTGPLENVLKAQYNPSILVGHLQGESLVSAIKGAAVVVVPSEWYENCPMSVLEAMAYGKPVVGSRIGGIPELVKDGQTGFLYDAGNVDALNAVLSKLMSTPLLRKQMGAAGRLRASTMFSLEKHHAGLMDIYNAAIGN